MKKKFLTWFSIALSVTLAILWFVMPANSQFPPQVREYWIKAEEILWDYAPSYPMNPMTDKAFNEDQLVFLEQEDERIGRIYTKAVFRSYTENFGTIIDGANEVINPDTGEMKIIRKPGTSEEHLGILGPTIRAEVGDTIVIHFLNETRYDLSMHPHGVFYTKANEGTPYNDGTLSIDKRDDAVKPNTTYTYTWTVPERAGPSTDDPTSIIWPYHSHVDEIADTNAGLVGGLIVYKKGSLNPKTGKPVGIDQEFVNLFTVFDENSSLYLDANIERFTHESVEIDDDEFVESNLMHGINGLLYDNLRGMNIAEGQTSRWYMLSTGTEVDIHTPHWHGETLVENGKRVDITEIFPASAKTLDMIADDPGIWMYHCHVNDHLHAGMTTVFTVESKT